MLKAMMFIDGTWLYSNTPRLSEAYGQPDFRVDFGKLPQVLSDEVSKQLGTNEIDVVRTYLFGSYASNYDPRDDDSVQRRRDFFDMLREEYHYEVETYPINFMGRRLRRIDRDPDDTFEPKEKCVDISLATSILYYAAIPYTYDIAIAVIGDQDFKPVLQHVRRLGKRVAIASIKGSCAPDYTDVRDEARVKDFDLIWLDDLLHRLELKYERHQLACESPIHRGKREVWTTFHPRKSQKFFCDACRREFALQRQDVTREAAAPTATIASETSAQPANSSADPPPDLPAPTAETGSPTVGPAGGEPVSSRSVANLSTNSEGGLATNSIAALLDDRAPDDSQTAVSTAFFAALSAVNGASYHASTIHVGSIKRRISDRGFGFVEGDDGRDYFFHLTDLVPGLYFDDIAEGMAVEYEVKKLPAEDRAGAAQRIRRHLETQALHD